MALSRNAVCGLGRSDIHRAAGDDDRTEVHEWLEREHQANGGGGKDRFHVEGPVGTSGRRSQASPTATTHVRLSAVLTRMVQLPVVETRTSTTIPSADRPIARGLSELNF